MKIYKLLTFLFLIGISNLTYSDPLKFFKKFADELKKSNTTSVSEQSQSVTSISKVDSEDLLSLHSHVTKSCSEPIEQVLKINREKTGGYTDNIIARPNEHFNYKKEKRFNSATLLMTDHDEFTELVQMNLTEEVSKLAFRYFNTEVDMKSMLIDFTNKNPSSKSVLENCIISINNFSQAGQKKYSPMVAKNSGSTVLNSNDFCSLYENNPGIDLYLSKANYLISYLSNPENKLKIARINQRLGTNASAEFLLASSLDSGIIITNPNKENPIDVSEFSNWYTAGIEKITGSNDYSNPNSGKEGYTPKDKLENLKKVVQAYSRDCIDKWRTSNPDLNLLFISVPTGGEIVTGRKDDGNIERYSSVGLDFLKTNGRLPNSPPIYFRAPDNPTFNAGLIENSKEQISRQAQRKAEHIDYSIKVIDAYYAAAVEVRKSEISNPENCNDYFISKNVSVNESGLIANVSPTQKIRSVSGMITDLTNNSGLLQGFKNDANLQMIGISQGAFFKYSEKTVWYVNKTQLRFKQSVLNVVGKYVGNTEQNYTNIFNRTESVKIPIIEAMCIEQGSSTPGLDVIRELYRKGDKPKVR